MPATARQRQERLTGMPGPSHDAIAKVEAVSEAFESVHAALMPYVEGLPVAEGSKSELHLVRRIKGDTISITFKPGASNGQ
jgi:hypothetical protein